MSSLLFQFRVGIYYFKMYIVSHISTLKLKKNEIHVFLSEKDLNYNHKKCSIKIGETRKRQKESKKKLKVMNRKQSQR